MATLYTFPRYTERALYMPRTKQVNLRLSPEEHTSLTEAADAAGLTVSEHVRQQAIGRGRDDHPAPNPLPEPKAARHDEPAGPTYEQRVAQLSRTMPRSNAQKIARAEAQRR